MDNDIIVDKNMSEINKVISELKETRYNVEDRSNIAASSSGQGDLNMDR